jgi:hypothetical protein
MVASWGTASAPTYPTLHHASRPSPIHPTLHHAPPTPARSFQLLLQELGFNGGVPIDEEVNGTGPRPPPYRLLGQAGGVKEGGGGG